MIFSRFKCMSLSSSSIFGVEDSKSSRNSVMRRAALLYFSLEWFIFYYRREYSPYSYEYYFWVLSSFFSNSSIFCSKKLIKSSLALLALKSIEFLMPMLPVLLWLLLGTAPLLVFSTFSVSKSLTYCFNLFITFWQKWLLLASSFSTSLWI